MNAYPPTSSHTDLPVEVQVVPPMGLPMTMQMECPVMPADRVAPIPPHTQETGLMKCKGAGRVLGSHNKPEPTGKEVSRSDPVMHLDAGKRDFIKWVDPNDHQSEPAATSSATMVKDTVHALP